MARSTWEVFSSQANPVALVSSLPMSVLWKERFRVVVGSPYGISHGQQSPMPILNAQRYNEIFRPIILPFICCHHLLLQPHVARICAQFLEAENVPVLAWPTYSPHTFVWDSMDGLVWQQVPIPANIQQQQLRQSGPIFHSPKSKTLSTLFSGYVSHCVMQEVVITGTWYPLTPTTPPCNNQVIKPASRYVTPARWMEPFKHRWSAH